MHLTEPSKNRFYATLEYWHVPRDFGDPMYSYLVHGHEPGSCFYSVLANDFYGAISRSHPANTIDAFKALVSWINDFMPAQAYGSYRKVDNWLALKRETRREYLEKAKLIYATQEETWIALRSASGVE